MRSGKRLQKWGVDGTRSLQDCVTCQTEKPRLINSFCYCQVIVWKQDTFRNLNGVCFSCASEQLSSLVLLAAKSVANATTVYDTSDELNHDTRLVRCKEWTRMTKIWQSQTGCYAEDFINTVCVDQLLLEGLLAFLLSHHVASAICTWVCASTAKVPTYRCIQKIRILWKV